MVWNERRLSHARPLRAGSVDEDRSVLDTLYKTNNGLMWIERRGWSADAEELKHRFGVTVDDEGRLIQLNLLTENEKYQRRGNNLQGDQTFSLR